MGRTSSLAALVLLAWCAHTGWSALCPYGGWQSYGGSCYFFYNANFTRSWNDARQRCLDQDADLVSIESTRERDWILNQVRLRMNWTHNAHRSWWTGINARPDGNTWKGPNSTAVNINLLNGKWASGQPRKDRNNQCVEIQNLKFVVKNCRTAYQAICERPSGRVLTCPPSYSLYAGQCYRYFGNAQNYNGAKTTCRRNGGILPQVFDADTGHAIWDLATIKGHNLWLSLRSSQRGNSYVWKWANGTTLNKPAYWASNPPGSLGRNVNSTCVEQQQTRNAARSWGRVSCNARRAFVCQKPEGSCPNGWLQMRNRCYFIYTHDAKTFKDSQSYCSGLGASLAALDSGDVVSFLYPYVHSARAAGAVTLWIGLTDNNQNNGPWKWVSTNRTIGSWHNWANNRSPNTANKQDCATIDSNDRHLKWHATSSCGDPHRFICQLPTNRPLRTPTQAPATVRCPRGSTLYRPLSTCIQLVSRDSTWDQARLDCGKRGADLVTIPNKAFNNFINSKIQRQRGKYWIGLHDRHHENRFEWLDSDSSSNYTNWLQGQPDNGGGNSNCVAIFDQNNYKWRDQDCGSRFHYICQAKPTQGGRPVTTTTHKPWSPNCGPLWLDDPNSFSCYMFNTERLSWMDARRYCQANHGDLVSINSKQEQFFINGRISRIGSTFIWVGANDRQTESGWRWADNSAMGFINWKAGQPNSGNNADCVGITNTDGQWSDFPCRNRYAFICEKMGQATPPPTTPMTSPMSVPANKVWGCPSGWRGFNGQCYVLVRQDHIDWQTARTKCGQMGGSLTSIHSAAENKFVYSLYPTGYRGYAWIGLNDMLNDGTFVWTDLGPVDYTFWSPGEPNNWFGREDCIIMYRTSKWYDFHCNSQEVGAFVCKKPMGLQDAGSLAIRQGCRAGLGFRAMCYAYINTPTKSWQAAQADCRRRHGNLATVNDRHIQAFVGAELTYRGGAAYWIGLKNAGAHNKTYVWATKYTFDFTYWAASHTGNEQGTCIGMSTGRPAGLWTNFPCNRHMPYICEFKRVGFTTPPPTPPTTTSKMPCPAGWRGYNNFCIKAFNLTIDNRLSWMESRQYCQSLGGDLTSIWGSRMSTYIYTRILKNATDGMYWIGLNDRDSEEGHVWSDGHGVAYTQWDAGEPNDYGNREDCVAWIFPSNAWNDDNCYLARNFICTIPRGTQLTTTAPLPSAAAGGQCKNDSWLQWKDNCYFLSPEDGPLARQTWYEARRTCRSLGADLVSVHGVDQNGFLSNAMSKHATWGFWIGLNDLSINGYNWINGDAVDFISWAPNEPNDDFGGESCVQSGSTGLWKDNNCQEMNGYICMRPVHGWATAPPTLPPVSGGCPTGYTTLPILENCYKVAGLTDDTRKNFTDALTACTQMSPPGTLASIHNYIEQTYIMTQVVQAKKFVWIGLNDLKRRNYFMWHDNSEVKYTHWGPGQPDENLQSNAPEDRRDCVSMNAMPRYAGNWNDMQCSNRFAYICQVRRAQNLQPRVPFNTGCPRTYSRHGKVCYKYHPTNSTWGDAQAACQQEHATLATFADRFQMNVVNLIRRPDMQHAWNPPDIWIGLSMPQGSSHFLWITNWRLTFTKWADSEPDNTGYCVKMDKNNYWHDHDCNQKYPFVCQVDHGGGPPPTTTVAGTCRDSTWSPQGQFCYKLFTDTPRSWPEARYACNVLDGALVSVHSQDEMTFVNNIFSSAVSSGAVADPNANAWIGLTKGFGGGFAWTDNTELEYDNWDQGEPSDTDNGLHQDCVQAAITGGKWNDVDCFDPNIYLCKAPKQPLTTPSPGRITPRPGQNTPWPGQNTPRPGQNTPRPGQNTPRPGQNTPRPGRPGVTNRPVVGRPTQWRPPYQGPVTHGPGRTYPIGGPATPAQQTGTQGGGDGGLSGGGIAGVIIGVVAIVAIALVASLFLLGRLRLPQRGPPNTTGGNGFDNALYSKAQEESGKGVVSFGTETYSSES